MMTLFKSARQSQQSGQLLEAMSLYRQLLQTEPDCIPAHYQLGLLLIQQKELAVAQTHFHHIITRQPTHQNALFYLGVLHLIENELELAERAFLNVLTFNKTHAQALNNLGVIALKRDQKQEAVNYFTQALSFETQNLEARNNLAATFIHHDRFENALTHYHILLEAEPNNIEYHYNAGVAQMALGYLKEAQQHFETILKHEPNHFSSLHNLAVIHIRLSQHKQAITRLTQALTAKPHDEASQFMLDALTNNQHVSQPSQDYVQHLFNNYALYYDQHLQDTLHYTLPQHLSRLVHQLTTTPCHHTLDLGCGTGLSGSALRDWSEQLTGVDIAANMLEQARKKNVYDHLIEADLLTFLQETSHPYDLIVALDVFPYLGELEPLFCALDPILTPHGFFIFSHEISHDTPKKLQISARFSHHPNYIQSLCEQHALRICHQNHVPARKQQGQTLHVMLYAVQKY